MIEARSAALWGHWVTDADRGAGLTVTGGGALSRVGETSPEMALSAPIDWGPTRARGSEPVLLDERNESSARRRADTPVTLTEGCRVTTGSTGSVGIACFTHAVDVGSGGGARGHAKTKEGLQTLQTNLKTGLGRHLGDRRRKFLPCTHA